MRQDPDPAFGPPGFIGAIEAELGETGSRDLRGAASALSQRYRSGAHSGFARGRDVELEAYLATRAPATFAAIRRALSEVASLRPDWSPRSLLDLGAGPGTATWAAAEFFDLELGVLVERDREMAALGARLFEGALVPPVATEWAIADAGTAELPESDLVVAAYILGELGSEREQAALLRWWRATLGELVIIEPGTPAGFERLRTARSELISQGAHVTAPCPHENTCPMQGSDWCHFAVRLQRSALHRELKDGRVGFEDEKYAYLAVSRGETAKAAARLVRSPRPHKGHVRLVVCESGGLIERVVSRRDGALYKKARAARWGDRIDPG